LNLINKMMPSGSGSYYRRFTISREKKQTEKVRFRNVTSF